MLDQNKEKNNWYFAIYITILETGQAQGVR